MSDRVRDALEAPDPCHEQGRAEGGKTLMCAHGDTVPMRVWLPARLSCTGQDRWTTKPIDRCIAPIVEALLAGGVRTVASCCGHGKNPGSIVLDDGRELIIAADREQAERMQAIYGTGKEAER